MRRDLIPVVPVVPVALVIRPVLATLVDALVAAAHGSTTTVVPIGAQFHRYTASGVACRTHPAESG